MAENPAPNPFAGLSPEEIVARLNAWQASQGGQPAAPSATPATPSTEDILARLGNQPSPSISAPATQQWILAQAKPGVPQDPDAPKVAAPPGYAWFRNAAYTPPKATTAEPTVFGSDETGRYIQDPTSPSGVKLLVPAHTPNADDEIKKALDREQAEQLRLQRQKNEAAGFGYADDDTVAKRSLEARAAGLDDRKFAQTKAMDDEKIRQFDIQQAASDRKDAASIGLITEQTAGQRATTARTGAETQQITGATERTAALLPGELTQQGLTAAGTEAATAGTQATTAKTLQSIQQGNAPTVQTPPTGMYQWQRDPNTGAITASGINPEYQAKTQAEVAARIGQIQSLMQAKGREVQAKADAGTITHEQALAEYNAWYAQNVQPQMSALEQAQQAAQFTQAKDVADIRQRAMTTAQNAGTLGINAFNALREANPVQPGYAQALNQIASKSPYMKGVDFGSTVWQGPNPVELAQQQTQQALKYLDPTAAMATGAQLPDFKSLDVNSLLGAQRYMPGATGGPPVGAGAGDLISLERLRGMSGVPLTGGAQAGGGMPAWLNGAAPPPPPPAPVPVSSGAVGPWAGGATPPPGTLWQNPDLYGQYQFGG